MGHFVGFWARMAAQVGALYRLDMEMGADRA